MMGSVGNKNNVIDARNLFEQQQTINNTRSSFENNVMNRVDNYLATSNTPTEFRDNVTNDFISTLERRLNRATTDDVKNVIRNELERLDSDIVSWLKDKRMENDTASLMRMRKRIRDLLNS